MYKIKIVFEDGDSMIMLGSYNSFEEADAKGSYYCRKAYVDLIYPHGGYPAYEIIKAGDE